MNRFCKQTGVGIIPWSPLFGGLLARPVGVKESVRANTPAPFGSAFTTADEEIVRRVEKVAKDKGWKMAQVGLLWLRAKGAIPIVGCNSIARVEEASELQGKSLTDEEVAFLEEPYVSKPITGHT